MNGHDLFKSNGITENGGHGKYVCVKQSIDESEDNSLLDPVHSKKSANGNGANAQHEFQSGVVDARHAEGILLVNSWYCVVTILATTASTMMSIGLAFGALNPTMIVLSSFYCDIYKIRQNETAPSSFTEVSIAFTVSIPFFGGLLGASSLGLFVRYLTRKKAMISINILNTVGVMLSSLIGYTAYSHECIIIGRLIMGYVSGVSMNLVPMVISETSTKQRAPLYLSLIGVNLSLGGLIGLTFGLTEVFGNDKFWPLLLALPSLPSIVYIASSPFLPDTPSYLISVKRSDEALKTLKRLRKNASYAQLGEEMLGIKREQDTQGRSKNHSLSLRTLLSRPGFRWQLFLVVMVYLESEFCGVNAIGMYTNLIFIDAGIPKASVTYASLIVYFVQFLVSLAGSAAVDKWGAKRLAVFWLTIMGVSMALLTSSVHFAKQYKPVSYVSVVAVTIYILSWACGPNITLFPLVSTLTTEATREASFKLGGVIFWISSWFVGFIPKFLMAGLHEYAYLIWMTFDVLFAVFFYFCLPETRGKTPEQIQAEIHSKDKKSSPMQPLQPI